LAGHQGSQRDGRAAADFPEGGVIAGTALEHDLILVTRNTKHFQRIPGLRLENWFE